MSAMRIAGLPQAVSAIECSYSNVSPPKDQAGVVYWGANHKWQPSGNPFHGYFTGLKIPGPRNQRQMANSPWQPLSTGMQLARTEVGIMIQSWSLRRDLATRRRLGTVVMSFDPKAQIFPFRNVLDYVVYGCDLKVPSAYVRGNAVAQVAAYFALADKRNKRPFWLGLNLFDTRGPRSGDIVHWDAGTNMPIVTAHAGQSSLIGGTHAGQHRKRKFSSYQPYRWKIDRGTILAAIQMLRAYNPSVAWSSDPADYFIDSVNLNPEIYVPEGWHNYAHIGLAVSDWFLTWVRS